MRLSQTLKDKDNDDSGRSTFKEKTLTVSEISRHSYFRKSKSNKLNETFGKEENNPSFKKIEVNN